MKYFETLNSKLSLQEVNRLYIEHESFRQGMIIILVILHHR